MRFNRRSVLCSVSAVALVAGLTVTAAVSAPAIAAGPNTTYLVLAPQGQSTAVAASRVAAAGGTVVADYSQIGVLVARSTNPSFDAVAAGAGVEAVAATTGFGTVREDGTIIQPVGAARVEATRDRTRAPLAG